MERHFGAVQSGDKARLEPTSTQPSNAGEVDILPRVTESQNLFPPSFQSLTSPSASPPAQPTRILGTRKRMAATSPAFGSADCASAINSHHGAGHDSEPRRDDPDNSPALAAKRRWMLALGEGEAETQGLGPMNSLSPERGDGTNLPRRPMTDRGRTVPGKDALGQGSCSDPGAGPDSEPRRGGPGNSPGREPRDIDPDQHLWSPVRAAQPTLLPRPLAHSHPTHSHATHTRPAHPFPSRPPARVAARRTHPCITDLYRSPQNPAKSCQIPEPTAGEPGGATRDRAMRNETNPIPPEPGQSCPARRRATSCFVCNGRPDPV